MEVEEVHTDSGSMACSGSVDSGVAFVQDKFNLAILQVVSQYLKRIGMSDIADTIDSRSGLGTATKEIQKFSTLLELGSWNELHDSISDIARVTSLDSPVKLIRILTYEEEFIQSLEDRDTLKALTILRKHISKLTFHESYLSNLANLLASSLSSPLEEWMRTLNGDRSTRRQTLVRKVCALTRCPLSQSGNRLDELLDQAIRHQYYLCHGHTSKTGQLDDLLSLLENHHCSRPPDSYDSMKVVHVFSGFSKPLSSKISPDGAIMAAVSRDGEVLVWSTKGVTGPDKVSGRKALVQASLCWSYDSMRLVVLFTNSITLVEVFSRVENSLKMEISFEIIDEQITCAAFLHGRQDFVVASRSGRLYHNVSNAQYTEIVSCIRAQTLYVFRDNTTCLISDPLRFIRKFSMENESHHRLTRLTHQIVNIIVDKEEKSMFIMTKDHYFNVQQCSVETGALLMMYQPFGNLLSPSGHMSLGGPGNQYLVVPSDSFVGVWNVSSHRLVLYLPTKLSSLQTVAFQPDNTNVLYLLDSEGHFAQVILEEVGNKEEKLFLRISALNSLIRNPSATLTMQTSV